MTAVRQHDNAKDFVGNGVRQHSSFFCGNGMTAQQLNSMTVSFAIELN